MAPNTPRRVRVAIVGGGCAGLSAAWQLSRQPGYEVHVYERSWRLGGKCASGRDRDGRIHEHGLHVWLGFYENAFRMMRECYAEVGKRGWGPGSDKSRDRLAHASLDEAFFPEPHIGVAGVEYEAGNVWSGHLPPAKGLPGTPLDEGSNPFTLANYLLRCFDLLKTLMLSVIGPPAVGAAGEPRPDERSKLDEAIELDFAFDPVRSPSALIERATRLLRTGALTTAAGLLQAITILENWVRKANFYPQVADTALELVEALAAQTRRQLRDLVELDPELRRKTEVIDIVMTIAVGLYRDRVLFDERGLDAINGIDYREWLLQHGATKTSVRSRFVTGIYDLVFAYRGGDRARPALAAGVALRGALRMFFTYRGSMFWRVRSGMGDAVVAPLYKVMLLDGACATTPGGREEPLQPVRFHFLHSLRGVEFDLHDEAARYVTRLTFDTWGDPARIDELGRDALDDHGCWPDDARRFASALGHDSASVDPLVHPRALADRLGDLFEQPATGKTVIAAGEDFDAVIFALGRDDFIEVLSGGVAGRTGAEESPFFSRMPAAWKRMRLDPGTVATQAAQVWLDRDLDELGWHRGSGLVTALDLAFDTWADMTHTLASERAWRATHGRPRGRADDARSVAYFCGVLPDEALAGRSRRGIEAGVRRNLSKLLDEQLDALWPAPSGRAESPARFELARHVQANWKGSDRYSLSLPGTIENRISPLDRSVLNMSVAGDWTACGLDAGCVEAAVMSGMLAAHAITGSEPPLQSIIGYDHP